MIVNVNVDTTTDALAYGIHLMHRPGRTHDQTPEFTRTELERASAAVFNGDLHSGDQALVAMQLVERFMTANAELYDDEDRSLFADWRQYVLAFRNAQFRGDEIEEA